MGNIDSRSDEISRETETIPYYPSYSNFRFPYDILNELRGLSISQIEESFQHFLLSQYTHIKNLNNQMIFDEIFGNLFSDTDKLLICFMNHQSVTPLNVFLLMTLLSADKIKCKINFILKISTINFNNVNKEPKKLTFDSIQIIFYEILSSVQFLFKTFNPIKISCYNFVENSLQKFVTQNLPQVDIDRFPIYEFR